MKNTFRTLVLVGIFYFICGNSCKKSTPSVTLPPITETGANTFGCKINGQVWLPYWRCIDLVAGANELAYNIQPIYTTSSLPIFISIFAGNSTNGQSGFTFQQNPSYSDHIYGTGNIIDSVIIHYTLGSGTVYTNYQTNPDQNTPRYLQISKLDTVNKIVSGTFAFTLYGIIGINTPDSVVITDGRFDLQFGSYSRCSPQVTIKLSNMKKIYTLIAIIRLKVSLSHYANLALN